LTRITGKIVIGLEAAMPSGTENRKRSVSISVRLSPEEAALVRQAADRAGCSVASLIRSAMLEGRVFREPPSRAFSPEDIARLLAAIGPIRAALEEAASCGNVAVNQALLEAACADLADMRALLFEASGRLP
jgi:uncharacterized protein (DUF1778 family)